MPDAEQAACPTCLLVPEEPDEPIEPGDYYTVDPTSLSRCPACGLVPSRDSEGARRVAATRAAEIARCGCTVGTIHRYACASIGYVDAPRTTLTGDYEATEAAHEQYQGTDPDAPYYDPDQDDVEARALVPAVNSTLHREVPTFRWELPKARCGTILHPYKTVNPVVADLAVRCPSCYPVERTLSPDTNGIPR